MTKTTQNPQSPTHHLQAGLEAQQAGDLATAHRCYLEAAKLLFAQARDAAAPGLRQERYNQGHQVMARAQEIATRLEARRQQEEAARRALPPLKEGEAMPDWLLAERPSLRLADVAGLDDVKEQIHLKLIYPFTHPAEAQRYGVRPGGGILLYGPPGVGKTYIARAIAGELDAAFFNAKASNLMSQWFGKAEQNIAALFAAARQQARAIIFLDEVEALTPKRSATASSVMPRVIAEFLAQTQSLGDESQGAVLLLGATNEPWAMDPAALRPGRFDELIYVGLPDQAARLRLLELNLRNRPLAGDVHLPALAGQLAGYSGADIAYLCAKASERAFLDAVERGLQREVALADFQALLPERKPSVTPEQMRRYEKFRRRDEG
jgi:SpoVK/Ycf46/Vps4 family AAA+-type ATPase